jgi:hypothetical protein
MHGRVNATVVSESILTCWSPVAPPTSLTES